jgi:hypothetical protein
MEDPQDQTTRSWWGRREAWTKKYRHVLSAISGGAMVLITLVCAWTSYFQSREIKIQTNMLMAKPVVATASPILLAENVLAAYPKISIETSREAVALLG